LKWNWIKHLIICFVCFSSDWEKAIIKRLGSFWEDNLNSGIVKGSNQIKKQSKGKCFYLHKYNLSLRSRNGHLILRKVSCEGSLS